MAGVWVWACAFPCLWQRETERSHKYVYLCMHVNVTRCAHITVCCCVGPCVFSHVQTMKFKKYIYQGKDNTWMLFGWQENIGLAVICLLCHGFDLWLWSTEKGNKSSFSCSHFLTDKIPTLFLTSSLAKTQFYPTNAGFRKKTLSNQLSKLVSGFKSKPVTGVLVHQGVLRQFQEVREAHFINSSVLRRKINGQIWLQISAMLIFTVLTITSELPINLNQLIIVINTTCNWKFVWN